MIFVSAVNNEICLYIWCQTVNKCFVSAVNDEIYQYSLSTVRDICVSGE